jgi:hypothetical protein
MTRKKSKTHTVSKTEKKKLGIAKTMKAASAITGISLSRVRSAAAHGCKAFRSNGTVDCEALVDFIATMPDEGPIDIDLEKARLMRANRMLKEQEHDERAKVLWPIEVVRQSVMRNVISCKTKLYNAENAIAVESGMRLNLTSDQVSTIVEIVRKNHRAAIKEMHAGELGKVVCPECRKEIAV